MKFTGNIEKDFENYLTETKLWIQWNDNPTKWIERIGVKMDQAAKRTSQENKNLAEEDYMWWVKLVELYNYYGPERDLFGEYLELKGITTQRNGQFFTPLGVCMMMNEMTHSDIKKEEVIKVSDCASGSGRMMIAHSIVAKRRDEKYSKLDYIYYNQDIDYKAFIFTTLNAVVRNLASVNVWGDTLAVKEYKTFITIPSSLGFATWHDREHELEKVAESERKIS